MAKLVLLREINKIFTEQQKKGKLAMAMAMTWTAKDVQKQLYDDMKKIFDNPTNFTLNSLFVIPAKANSTKLFVAIKVKDFAGKGTPASKYLSAQIEGGGRAAKSSERLLRDRAMLASNRYALPGSGLKLNQYGNIPGSKMTQILSAVKAFSEVGSLMNKSTRNGKENKTADKYFVIKDGDKSHLKPGIYYRYGGKNSKTIKPILIFTDAPKYNKRFDFFMLSNKYYNQLLQSNIIKAQQKVFAT